MRTPLGLLRDCLGKVYGPVGIEMGSWDISEAGKASGVAEKGRKICCYPKGPEKAFLSR